MPLARPAAGGEFRKRNSFFESIGKCAYGLNIFLFRYARVIGALKIGVGSIFYRRLNKTTEQGMRPVRPGL